MGFKYFQGLLQIAVALSVAEWMTETNVNQDFVPNQFYSPYDLLNRIQGQPVRPSVQNFDYNLLSHGRLVTQKEQGLLQQLLSLDSACDRGDIAQYGSFSAWPLQAHGSRNSPDRVSPDDVGYGSGSESGSGCSSSSPFSGAESIFSPRPQEQLPNQQFTYSPIHNFNEYGAATLPSPSDELDNLNLNIEDFIGPEYDLLNFNQNTSPPPQKADFNNLPLNEGAGALLPLPGQLDDEIAQYLKGASDSPVENISFFNPGIENNNADYDPFLVDFGLSGSSSSEEDFSGDLEEALSTFDKFYKGSPQSLEFSKGSLPSTKLKAGLDVLVDAKQENSPLSDLKRMFSEESSEGNADKLGSLLDNDVSKSVDMVQDRKKSKLPKYFESASFDPRYCIGSDIPQITDTNATERKEDFITSLEKTKSIVNVGEEVALYKGKGARPKVRKVAGLSYSEEELIHMPVEKFNTMIEELDYEQASLAKDIRRKGKNKVAARNCRKRKMDAIQELDSEITQIDSERQALLDEQAALEKEMQKIKSKTEWLYDYIFDSLRDDNGHPYSREHYSLQYTSDGAVYLVPNNSALKGSSTTTRSGNNRVL